MYSLINSLPWYFWVLWGITGVLIVARWAIRSKGDPILLRISWSLMAIVSLVVAIHSFTRGSGIGAAYWEIVDKTAIPLLITTVLLLIIGGYQKVMRPGYNLAKRKMFINCVYGLLGSLIGLGVLIGLSYYR